MTPSRVPAEKAPVDEQAGRSVGGQPVDRPATQIGLSHVTDREGLPARCRRARSVAKPSTHSSSAQSSDPHGNPAPLGLHASSPVGIDGRLNRTLVVDSVRG